MLSTTTYTACPACNSSSIAPALVCCDHTVSKKRFEVWECHVCTLRFTQHVPDASSIGAFYQSDAYVSHSDTNAGLVNRLYHLVRNRTLRSKKNLVQAVGQKERGSLLDVGAGTGAFAQTMVKAGWTVKGLEPDATARKNAFDKYGIVLQTLESLHALPSKSFHVITLWHVLEHVHELHGYLTKFADLLTPNGTLLVAVPNYTSRDAQHYKEYWAAYDVPRHLYHFSPASMKSLLANKGFELTGLKPMWFDSIYVSMLSEKYLSGGSVPAALWNGLLSNVRALTDTQKCSSIIYIIKAATHMH